MILGGGCHGQNSVKQRSLERNGRPRSAARSKLVKFQRFRTTDLSASSVILSFQHYRKASVYKKAS
jgi:hypothetical protein